MLKTSLANCLFLTAKAIVKVSFDQCVNLTLKGCEEFLKKKLRFVE
jgi:hypothetical protein